MSTNDKNVDRSRDVSQPLDRLGPDETLKAESDYLRGTISTGLLDRITGAVPDPDIKLLKFHGMYQQDDRDIRDERRRQKLEPAYHFMIRVRMPGGVCTPEHWLKLDELARAYGGDSIRLTTRQTIQFHWVLKENVRAAIQGLHDVLLDTIAACGDDARGVMSTANPLDSALHEEVARLSKELSDHVIPRMRAYHEIWYGDERVATSEPEEPFYGKTYLPRKFKIGFAIPPSNDIDIYTQDLGYIAIGGADGVEGFNITIGGGMGRTDNVPTTYPRLADLIGYIPKSLMIPAADAVMSVQRDYGNRVERPRARFKYTVDDKGVDWVKGEIERRMGSALEPARPFQFDSNGDIFGWRETANGRFNYTLYVASGRVVDGAGKQILAGLRAIARIHKGMFRLTPNQNVIIADVAAEDRAEIEALLAEHGLEDSNETSALRLNSIACVALPTCALAMAEAERYLPDFLGKVEKILEKEGLRDDPITIRISGCPNGCSRPYVAEIALTGRAPGKYNLYLGGGFHGERLNTLYRENIGEDAILEILSPILARYAKERETGERFGDFIKRAGYLEAA
ncbi:assimilatory sulfite reductase (NADPH) hemoprotein subunit [Sphingosinicella rhizophila]|uniref:Sulfite reductase [NADPH] hemoprotein beta-component n=1 Tax=Sphingosinicella rhizophila TaxID=3050082 RepID=A0ABU3Q1U7_9SPHN|nr:assimilatory sulfite reductase (NADPH) hemoprotein subunit [Sphingosinicella sp. GR2756]MDT9597399.1 assimilatory sulfite reductase (NADPH) hemoprotein subunit [Sphingosinicella sp. GR2756]